MTTSETIEKQTEEFEQNGGTVQTIPTKEELNEIRRKKKALAAEEKRIKEALDENKTERSEAKDKLKETKQAFEENRKALGKNTTALNAVHLSKSALKHHELFKEVATTFLLSSAETEKSLAAYMSALDEAKELGL